MLQFHAVDAVLAAEPRAFALVALVMAASVCDWRTRRVPNVLTGAGAVAGFVFAAAHVGAGPSFPAALAGCAVGLVLLLPLYLARAMGAGDVKLMAAVGAMVGPGPAAYTVLFTFMAGGALALAWALWQRRLARLVANFRGALFASIAGRSPASEIASVGRMPYALAICVGTLACLALRQPFSP